jgi:hypothetical protein
MDNLEAVVAEAKKFGLSGTIDSGAVISVGVKLASFVNNLPGLKGKEKSELVVSAIMKCIDEMEAAAGGEKGRFENLKDTARVALPSAIQAVIDVSNGKFSIKKVKASTLLSWFSCVASSAISVAATAGVINKEQVKSAEKVLEKVENVEKVAAKLEGGASVNGAAKEVVAAVASDAKVEEAVVAPVAAVAEVPVPAAVAEVPVPAAVAEVPPPAAEVPPPAAEVPPPAGN